jgi:hypothetical protein
MPLFFGTSIPSKTIAIIFVEFFAWPSSVPALKYFAVNMKTWPKTVLRVLGVLMILSSVAHAQPRGLEVNLFGIGTVYSSKDYEINFPQSAVPVPSHFNFDKGLGGGVRVNWYTRGHWGEEFFFTYEPNTAHFTQINARPATSLNLDMKLMNIGTSALYYLNDDETHRIRPFLSVGVGWAVYQLTELSQQIVDDPLRGNAPDMNNSYEISLNYGAGFKARLNNWVGIRVDGKGYVGRNPSFGLTRNSSNPNATVFPAGGAINSGELSAGFVFYFGKP